MKTQIIKIATLSFVLVVSLLTTSCKNNDVMPETNFAETGNHSAARSENLAILQFDGEKFGKAIETYMNGKVAGYGYNVMHDGMLVAGGGGGWARKSFESNPVKHSYHQRQGIASSTKFVTALATVAVLEKYKIPLSAYVYLYLPVSWKPGETFKKITFERLLAHRTGLVNNGGTWEGFKKTVEGPIQQDEFDANIRDYDNINYALLGIVLPYIVIKKTQSLTNQQLLALENFSDNWYSVNGLGFQFRNIVRNYVFKPAGLQYWNVMDYAVWNNYGLMNAELGTKGYPSANGTEPGLLKGDTRINGGAGGLYISPNEFGHIQLAAAQGKIVTDEIYEEMKTKRLGFDGIVNGVRGKYYWKNGGADNHETMIFDMGRTQICVFTNSGTSQIGNDATIIANAYDSAWVIK
jgi:Beta-lactamase